MPSSITEQEEVQVEVTRLLVECYFDIVRANLQVDHTCLSPTPCPLRAPNDGRTCECSATGSVSASVQEHVVVLFVLHVVTDTIYRS